MRDGASQKKGRRMRPLTLLSLVVAAAVACTDSSPLGVDGINLQQLPPAGARGITVMTRNVYVGADLDAVIQAPADSVPFVVAVAYQQLHATDFDVRAAAFANEIQATKPHVVGLQEISKVRTQSPGDFFTFDASGNPVVANPYPNASTLEYDYLDILLDTLQARGLDYQVGAIIQNLDIELPMYTGSAPIPFDDVRLTDYDVILVRGDVEFGNARAENYGVSYPVPGTVVEMTRGWASVDATVAGTTFRFVSTHTFSEAKVLRQAQMAELLPAIGNDLPVILVGDFNAQPGVWDDAYELAIGQGFIDLWTEANPADDGYTASDDPSLMSSTVPFYKRIDFALARGWFASGSTSLAGGVHATVVGDELSDRVGGLWPSDHAGLVATIAAPPQ